MDFKGHRRGWGRQNHSDDLYFYVTEYFVTFYTSWGTPKSFAQGPHQPTEHYFNLATKSLHSIKIRFAVSRKNAIRVWHIFSLLQITLSNKFLKQEWSQRFLMYFGFLKPTAFWSPWIWNILYIIKWMRISQSQE